DGEVGCPDRPDADDIVDGGQAGGVRADVVAGQQDAAAAADLHPNPSVARDQVAGPTNGAADGDPCGVGDVDPVGGVFVVAHRGGTVGIGADLVALDGNAGGRHAIDGNLILGIGGDDVARSGHGPDDE